MVQGDALAIWPPCFFTLRVKLRHICTKFRSLIQVDLRPRELQTDYEWRDSKETGICVCVCVYTPIMVFLALQSMIKSI